MFLPSHKALIHLCNALTAYGGWHPLLQRFGLADAEGYADAESMGEPEMFPQEFSSWSGLMAHLDSAKRDADQQLRALCSDLLRDKDRHGSTAHDGRRFLDELAGFEAQLLEDGYHFSDLEIVDSRTSPSVAQQADDALHETLRLEPIPLRDTILKHLEQSKHHLSDGRYEDSLTNLRLTLKYSLEAVATKLAESRAEQLPSKKEDDVRNYLKRINFLSEDEWRGFWGIYGLLSVGPHGRADKRIALLGYAACVAACEFVIHKLQKAGSS